MHLDRAHMHAICSEVGTRQIGVNALSSGTWNCFRLSGMFSSQYLFRLAGTPMRRTGGGSGWGSDGGGGPPCVAGTWDSCCGVVCSCW